jgi:hypothetical protein
MTPNSSIPHDSLLALLKYARAHHHSRFWIPAILRFLTKGVRHG